MSERHDGGNLQTMERMILDDTHSLVSSTVVRLKIIKSIKHHKSQRLWFGEKTFRFNLTANRASYAPGDGFGLPDDLMEIVGDRIWVTEGGDANQRQPIDRIDTDLMEHERALDTTADQPFVWDFHDGALRLQPVPSSAADVLDGRYVSDIGVPRGFYNGSAWVFETPDGQATLSGTYTSDWFRAGAEPVRHYAVYLLAAENLRDDSLKQTAQILWAEALAALRDESERKTAPSMIRPRIW